MSQSDKIMNPPSFTWCFFVLFFNFEYSTQLSLSKGSASLSQYFNSIQTAASDTEAEANQHQQPIFTSFFNLTYGSRLLAQLGDQVNSLPLERPNSVVSHSCALALRSLLNQPTLHRWSLLMLDANAPMPASLLSDGITSLGGYDQCLAINDHIAQHLTTKGEEEVVSTRTHIRGQYCLLSLKANAEEGTVKTWQQDELQRTLRHLSSVNRRFPLVLGMCIPSSCRPEEVNYLIRRYFSAARLNFQAKVEHCQSAHDSSILGANYEKSLLELLQEHNLLIVSCILATVAILVLASTLVDTAAAVALKKHGTSEHSLLQKQSSQFSFFTFKILQCFSLTANTAILFGQNHSPSNSGSISKSENIPIERRLAFLHGVRVALLAWIVAAHSVALLPVSIAMPLAMIARHPHDMLALAAQNRLSSTFFNNGTLAVEAFFLISGLLLVTLSLEKRPLLQRITLPLFIGLRWLRFAPPLLGTIVFWKLASLLGSGPFFAKSLLQTSVQRPCQDGDWWRVFLFTNNWGNLSDTCIPPSWFLSADMQIHLLAYVLVVLLRRRLGTCFVLFCGAMISLSLAIPVTLLAFARLKTFSNVDLFASTSAAESENSLSSYILLYTGAHVHMGAYFYGALLGYFLIATVKRKREKIAEKSPLLLSGQLTTGRIIWWSSLAVTLLGPLVSTSQSFSSDEDFHLRKGLLIGGLHLLWTLAFGLVLLTFALNFPSESKSVQLVRRLLSWSLFRPLSRLSFAMYLTHMLLIWFNVYSSRVPFEVNSASMTLFTLGIFAETLALSYLLFILFEAPSVNLIKLAFGSVASGGGGQPTHSDKRVKKGESCKDALSSEATKAETLLAHNNNSNRIFLPTPQSNSVSG